MAVDSFKVKKSLNIEPIAGAAPSAEGDVTYDATAHKASIHNGTTASPLVTEAHSATLTNKSIDGATNTLTNIPAGSMSGVTPVANGGTNSSTALNNDRIMKSSGGAIVEAAAITASRALASDTNGIPVASTTTAAELDYVAGVTSSIQTQINAKAPSASPTFSGTVTTPLTASRAVVTGSSSELAASSTTAAEIGYVAGVTSAIQTQLDAKIAKTLTTTTGDMIYASSANTPARLPIGASGQVLKTVGGVPTWATFSGGINYLSSNADAESDTTGWTTYADAAGSSPVDGTGGSPNSTWTRSTSSPLRGSGSFLWTKSGAANRQGEGVAFDFTIDSTDQAKVLSVTFDYKIASGTYADGDLTVYIYDVTNALVIQPAGYSIQNASVSMRHTATFQTASNSTSYRLIIHTASTSTSNYTVQFDNFVVGPQAVVQGTPVTDWQSYTPTLTNAGTTSTNTAWWRRVGDSIEIDSLAIFTGAGTGSTWTFGLPSGISIDTNKTNGTTVNSYIGNVAWYDSSGSDQIWGFVVPTSGNTSLTLYMDNGSGSAMAGNALASGDYIRISARFPVVGWSSNVQMSNDTDTRVVAASYSASGAISWTATGGGNFDTKQYDTHNAVTTGSNAWKFTAPVPGKYKVSVQIFAASSSQYFQVYKNGTAYKYICGLVNVVGGNLATGSIDIDLVAGDYIDVRLDGGTLTGSSSSTANNIHISRVSGPSAIAASETVAASYSTLSSTSYTTPNALKYTTKLYDSHNAYNTSTGIFTAPISGIYRVTIAASYTSSGTQNYAIYKNTVSTIAAFAQTVSPARLNGSMTIRCLAGDAITVVGDTTLTYGATDGYFSIERIGNY